MSEDIGPLPAKHYRIDDVTDQTGKHFLRLTLVVPRTDQGPPWPEDETRQLHLVLSEGQARSLGAALVQSADAIGAAFH